MYFLGLPFQYAASSALIPGVGRDAKYLAHEIAHYSRKSSTDIASLDQFGHRAVVNAAAGASPEEGANKV
jgi:hypothetical protein